MGEMAQAVRKFIEHWEYYRALNAKLELDFEEIPDKAAIPGYNFDESHIEEREDGIVIDFGAHTLGVHLRPTPGSLEHPRDDERYVRWWDSDGESHKPELVEIVTPQRFHDP
jgi:hypothetical protein